MVLTMTKTQTSGILGNGIGMAQILSANLL